METRRQSGFLDKMKREPLSNVKDAFGGSTDESGTEGETGESHSRGTDEHETENGSGESRAGGENEVVGDLGSEFLALTQ